MSDAKKAKKNKKINKMTAQELDKAIETTIKEMGDLNSRYGRELQKRKEVINSKVK